MNTAVRNPSSSNVPEAMHRNGEYLIGVFTQWRFVAATDEVSAASLIC